MMKMVTLLERAPGDSHEAFRSYWEEAHAPLVDDLPGVRRYVTSLPTDPGRSEYDGVAELYFDDMDALKAAFDTEAGRRLRADAAEFTDPDAGVTLFVEETVRLDESG